MKYVKLFEEFQQTNIHSPEFKEWFGDWEEAHRTKDYSKCSLMVDGSGEPMQLSHATRRDFKEFDKSKPGGGNHDMGRGLYFADKENMSGWFDYVKGNSSQDMLLYSDWIFKFKYGYDWRKDGGVLGSMASAAPEIEDKPFSEQYLKLANKNGIKSTSNEEMTPEDKKTLDDPSRIKTLNAELVGLAKNALNLGSLSAPIIRKFYANVRRLKFVEEGFIDNMENGDEDDLYDAKIAGSMDDVRQGIIFEPNANVAWI